ncbi:CHAP domain-containing protein [Colidextribacter sp. OB.20]|uniref:CHAP domain-containing protein n=1 Tax=Colidextribacter sp. OB.20 TaxID=2304568 RepID=UPI00325FD092
METSIKAAKRPAQAMGQTAKATGRGAKGTVKSAQRTVKTAQRTAKGTVKTAQHTSKTAIKTADHTAKAAQKTAQATAKAAKMTAHAARATAKTAAATAKAAAKGVSATVKAMIASVKALVAAIAAGGWVAILAIVIICLIGLIVGSCFGIFFSGEDSGTGQTMPAVVREINQEYEGKLEGIKNGTTYDTLEMSGSRAVWPEVLAIYAVKTTTDPDNPQEVATMDDGKKELLKEIFWAMNEISSHAETAITTQTIETDDGAGNIIEEEVEVTTMTLYITVTHKTADEMADAYNFTADQRAQLAELLAEENRSMWSSALYGIGVGDGEIVVVALSQLGNVGGQPYWSWYGFNSRVEWCACFVSWCANECGYLDAGVIPRTAGCISGSDWFKDRGLWQDNSYEPRPGDIIYFDWNNKGSSGPQDGLADHVGIVEKVENGLVYTVEGNSGDSCRENRYAVGHYEIYGYGTPAY